MLRALGTSPPSHLLQQPIGLFCINPLRLPIRTQSMSSIDPVTRLVAMRGFLRPSRTVETAVRSL
jgi:hypothetical protein